MAVHKDLIVYMKYINEEKEVTTLFAGTMELPNGQAQTIHDKVTRRFQPDKNLDFQVSF